MEKHPISIQDLSIQPFTTFDPAGVLLVSGQSVEVANVMTISWGMFGVMWGKPVMMVMVRPTRHTWKYISEAQDFTVNWMSEEWRDAVSTCGMVSGRDTNKFADTGLLPVKGTVAQSPVIAQSILTLECRIVYRSDVNPNEFVEKSLQDLYEAEDYHGLFFGEVIAATGIDQFQRANG